MEQTAEIPHQPPRSIRIGDLLLERGLIDQEQVERALNYQRQFGHAKLLGEVLVELGFVTTEQVLEQLAEAHGVPFARVTPRLADPRVLDILPRDFLEKQAVLPLFCVRGKLTVAVHELTNVFLIEDIQRQTECHVQLVAATERDIRAVLEAYHPDGNVFVIDQIVDDLADADLTLVDRQVKDLADIEQAAGDSPVIKVVNHVIYSAVREGASDIHIEGGEQSLRVRYRVDGRLYEKMRPPHPMLPAIVSRIKIMAGLDISERRVPQDGVISVLIAKRPVDLRVSTMPGKFGEKVVIRITDQRSASVGLEQLGFSPDMLQRWRGLIGQPNGVVLVTGPTGSGKSTTLYASLQEIQDDRINLCTVEDPVENHLEGINQFQVHEKAGFTFASALRSLLRQDPDIIMVGEIRDAETARTAVQAALTGHLVLSTLHTNDAPSAVTRLLNIGVEPYLVAAALRGVLAQRLLRKICTHCREEVEITSALQRSLERVSHQGPPLETFYHGTGCSKCRQTGYAGRIGVYEFYVPDDDALDAITRGATLQEIRRLARDRGMPTLMQDGLEKVRAGVTTLEELFRATVVV